MTPDQLRARGIRMKAMLDDPDVQEGLKSIERDLTEAWKACHDAHERDNLWRAVNIMDRLKGWLVSAASHDLTALRRTK